MGNYVSCTLAPPMMRTNKATRVIFPGGEVRQFRQALKAAELMLECPTFFLVNSQSLHIGRRFSALGADEELEFGNVYVMFPMRRLSSVVTAADMAALFMTANSAAKRIAGGNRVGALPESSGDQNRQETGNEQDSGSRSSVSEGFQMTPEFRYRLSVCRSRKPMLETIKEEPPILSTR